jgi:beta-lactam-binding protein with PASTA domain
MPNVVGLNYAQAQAALQSAGVLNLNSIGYFGTWPITANWKPSQSPPSTVLAQSPNSGVTVAVNASISLTLAEFRTAVAYP